ncbi:MAG TPA: YdcF family protein [Rhizomicrobium sp.]|nr:YdcF family protein [Rhizomicrobium sp.]
MLKRACHLVLLLAGLAALGSLGIALAGLNDDIEPSDLAVVLGSQVLPDGQPSARLQARLDEAVVLYRQGVCGRILVSGGTGKEGFSEAQVMARYLVDQGKIPGQAIMLDEHGDTTEATALNTAQIMRDHKLKIALIVTQYYHVPRTRLAFKKAGIPIVHGAHARFFSLRDFYAIPRELIALPVYGLRQFPKKASHGSGANLRGA